MAGPKLNTPRLRTAILLSSLAMSMSPLSSVLRSAKVLFELGSEVCDVFFELGSETGQVLFDRAAKVSNLLSKFDPQAARSVRELLPGGHEVFPGGEMFRKGDGGGRRSGLLLGGPGLLQRVIDFGNDQAHVLLPDRRSRIDPAIRHCNRKWNDCQGINRRPRAFLKPEPPGPGSASRCRRRPPPVPGCTRAGASRRWPRPGPAPPRHPGGPPAPGGSWPAPP